MKGLRELYPSIQLVFSFDFAEVLVCFVGFLSGKSAVSVANLKLLFQSEDELEYLTMTLELRWLSYSFQV